MTDEDRAIAKQCDLDLEIKHLELRTSTGASAIRTPGIINAAAVAAIMNILANAVRSDSHLSHAGELIFAIILFVVGLMTSALAAGFSYWYHSIEHQHLKARRCRASDGAEGPSFGGDSKGGRRAVAAARVCVIVSYLLLIAGAYEMTSGLWHSFVK